MGIYNTMTGAMALFADETNIRCQNSFIDETGCFICMIDETKTKTNVYVIDWNYEVEAPVARHRRHSTIESLDAPSEKGGGEIKDAFKS